MKLISKTILYYLLISLPLLAIAGFYSYRLIKTEVKDGTDQSLWKEKNNAEALIKTFTAARTVFLSADSISKITSCSIDKKGHVYTDSVIYDPLEEEHINHRILQSYFLFNHQNYSIRLAKPTYEEEELVEGLLSSFALILGFLVIAFFFVNWLLSKTLWKPFYKTVNILNDYDIKKHQASKFEPSVIKEFSQLNEALNKMTEKILTDYLQQKEFTENASHEMQTPLAVIKASVNLLMQSPNIQAEEMNHLQAIDNTVKKLSALNKALILLARIENNQFNDSVQISIHETTNKVIAHYEDIIQAKGITLENKIIQDIQAQMNPALAEILISNLLQNAIRHNFQNGKISIEIINNALLISNSGEALNISSDELFVRFKKNDASKESLGLGLSIVKSITSLYNITISYQYQKPLHTFTLKF